jgi:hypothetical protein
LVDATAKAAEQIAHLVVGNREVALVVGAIGLGLRQPLSDRERLAKGLSRLVALAEAAEQIAHLGEKDAFDSMKSAFRRTAKRIGPTLQ